MRRGADARHRPPRDKASVVARVIDLLEQAHADRVSFVAFPELALTTFFPRHWVDRLDALDPYYEHAMPGAGTLPLFDAAKRLGIGFAFGFRTAYGCWPRPSAGWRTDTS